MVDFRHTVHPTNYTHTEMFDLARRYGWKLVRTGTDKNKCRWSLFGYGVFHRFKTTAQVEIFLNGFAYGRKTPRGGSDGL